MSRKHNPMVALVALLLLAVLLLLAGCNGTAAAAPEEPESPLRFTVERHLSYGSHIDFFYIITDTETGGQYLWARDYYAGGMTVLQPAPEEVTTS